MKRDASLFSDDFKVEISNKVTDYDTSHIYTGHIYGKYNILNGLKCKSLIKCLHVALSTGFIKLF